MIEEMSHYEKKLPSVESHKRSYQKDDRRTQKESSHKFGSNIWMARKRANHNLTLKRGVLLSITQELIKNLEPT